MSLEACLIFNFIFQQVKLSVSGRNFNLILIARRSRHYAGTRYLIFVACLRSKALITHVLLQLLVGGLEAYIRLLETFILTLQELSSSSSH